MKNILIVDDEAINLMLLEDLIKDIIKNITIPVKITKAENGKEAFELYKNNDFDIIFMDIYMPIISGVEATIKIREINKMFIPPIIATTAYNISEIEDYYLAKFDGYMQKPISRNGLQKFLELVLLL